MAIKTNFEGLEPPSTSRNAALSHALVVKMDEFYTHYDDVAKEMDRHALQFAGKAILCNCDDPFESAFFRYFLLNFRRLGLSKLISTCYAGSPIAKRGRSRIGSTSAYTAVITDVPGGPLIKTDGSLDLTPLLARPANSLIDLTGDGDFRSDEALALLSDVDIVATNPPFSLFRNYMNLLVQHRKDFIILGNMNAATYREVFPLFRDNLLWYGESIRSGDRQFYVPDSYPLHAANCGIDDAGRRFIRVKGVRWFTNLDTQRRHETIDLTCRYTPQHYPKYDNYDAIEVGRTQNIPADYDGIMGVPITFLDKYNPDQFDIVMLANGNARTNVPPTTLEEAGYRPHPEDRGGVGIIEGRRVYARILIRRAAA